MYLNKYFIKFSIKDLEEMGHSFENFGVFNMHAYAFSSYMYTYIHTYNYMYIFIYDYFNISKLQGWHRGKKSGSKRSMLKHDVCCPSDH